MLPSMSGSLAACSSRTVPPFVVLVGTGSASELGTSIHAAQIRRCWKCCWATSPLTQSQSMSSLPQRAAPKPVADNTHVLESVDDSPAGEARAGRGHQDAIAPAL